VITVDENIDGLPEEIKREFSQEISEACTSTFSGMSEEDFQDVANQVIDASLTGKSGNQSDERTRKVKGDRLGGRVSRVDLIKYRPTRALELVSSSSLTVGTAIGMPVLLPFAAIVLWRSLSRSMSVEINTQEAFVYWVLWKHSDPENKILKKKIPNLVHEEESNVEFPINLTGRSINDAISTLRRVGCIESLEMNGKVKYQIKDSCEVDWE